MLASGASATRAGPFPARQRAAGLARRADRTDPGGADDALDDLLVLLLAALDTVPLLEWPEAERGVYGDQEYPAYLVTINVNTTKEVTAMAVVPLTSPYSLKAATFEVELDDFTAAVSQVQFDPSTSSTTWRGIGGNVRKDQSVAEWTCTLGLAQDLAPGGLLRYLLDNEGQTKDVCSPRPLVAPRSRPPSSSRPAPSAGPRTATPRSPPCRSRSTASPRSTTPPPWPRTRTSSGRCDRCRGCA
jgi:hypothetical protein